MITAPRNAQAAAPRWRTERIPPHEHAWVIVGTDGRGEVYQICTICDARSNTPRPRRDALLQDWLEYRVDWDDAAEPAPAPVVAEAVAPEDEEFDGTPIKRGPGRPRKY